MRAKTRSTCPQTVRYPSTPSLETYPPHAPHRLKASPSQGISGKQVGKRRPIRPHRRPRSVAVAQEPPSSAASSAAPGAASAAPAGQNADGAPHAPPQGDEPRQSAPSPPVPPVISTVPSASNRYARRGSPEYGRGVARTSLGANDMPGAQGDLRLPPFRPQPGEGPTTQAALPSTSR